MSEQIKVTLYGQSTCPWSHRTRAWLDNERIVYDFVDYDLADEGMRAQIQDEMVGRGASAFPFVKFGDDDFIVGYNPDAFARLLGLTKEGAPAAADVDAGGDSCAADIRSADAEQP